MPSPEDVAHLCRRAGFGATARELREFCALASIDAVVDRILGDPRLAGAPKYASLPRGFSAIACGGSSAAWSETQALGRWWLDRMAASRFVDTRKQKQLTKQQRREWLRVPHPLREKLTLFWHGLLVSSLDKGALSCRHPNLLRQHFLFRRHAIGDYAALLAETCRDPAMLLYLDNWTSTRERPSENFARELLELFSVGVGNFTHADVLATARAGTGYGLSASQLDHELHPQAHDSRADKNFFGALANWDLTGDSADADRTDLVEALCSPSGAGPLVARNLAKMLWEYFAYFAPWPPLVDELATAFLASGRLRLGDLLRAIFTHPEFYGPGARSGKLKNPVEWSVMLLRGVGMQTPFLKDISYDPVQSSMQEMGLLLFHQPTVFGWWRRPESRWIHLSAFQGKAEAVGVIGRILVTSPEHPIVQLAKLPSAEAIDGAFARFGVSLVAGDPTREQGIRMLDAMRAERCSLEELATNLLRYAVLTPPSQVN